MDDIYVRDLEEGTLTWVSVPSTGPYGNQPSISPAISADGRYVAFESSSINLVAGDTNSRSDIFVRDLVAGTTTRASVNGAGVQGNGNSLYPSLSADGSYVAFQSNASNLVAGDANGTDDVFVHELAVDNDPDSDGLSDLQETALGTNPLDPDSDGDGYDDGVEVAEESDPLSAAETPCGNGTLELPETCDDADAVGGDGCSATCQIDPGFHCSGQPSVCAPLVAVPALSGFALIAMGALLGLTGVLAACGHTR